MEYKCDMHIHSVLSPCGSWDNTPVNICATAREKDLDIISLTDHNAIYNIPHTMVCCNRKGVYVVPGIEITTREEVHLLGYFETYEKIELFYKEFEKTIPRVKNNADINGYQIIVDDNNNVVKEISHFLNMASNWSIDKCVEKIHEYGGIAILAHIDRAKFSIISQMGFIPPELPIDGIEMKGKKSNYPYKYPVIFSSDAHYPENIGEDCFLLEMTEINYANICKALREKNIKRCKGG